MHLGKLYRNFDSRCESYSRRIQQIQSSKGNIENWEFNYKTEVLISDMWQSWCHFTRELIFSSCRGTLARDGTGISERSGNNEWKRLGYEASRNLRSQALTANGHNNFRIRHEPTWGDLDNISAIVSGLAPHNMNTIISAYGSFYKLKDMQMVRNACAHKNVETLMSLNPLATRYHIGTLKNATQVAWSIGRGTTNELAIEQWLFEMNMIADLSTSTN